ncbi:MAG: putative toxin-antitoxin system toxin component, PIN family [Rhodocyclaceae bacterium]
MSGKQRLVIDTSTLIGAVLRPNTAPRQAFLAALNAYELCVSQATLGELAEVLQRPKFERYAPLHARLVFLDLLTQRAHLWEVDAVSAQASSGVCRDTKDTKFLALALACKAVFLVSSDEDLLVLNPWSGVQILTPAAFLQSESA